MIADLLMIWWAIKCFCLAKVDGDRVLVIVLIIEVIEGIEEKSGEFEAFDFRKTKRMEKRIENHKKQKQMPNRQKHVGKSFQPHLPNSFSATLPCLPFSSHFFS